MDSQDGTVVGRAARAVPHQTSLSADPRGAPPLPSTPNRSSGLGSQPLDRSPRLIPITTHALDPRAAAVSGPPRHQKWLPRKEVIQPQLPLRLPCYDFVPITRPTLDGCPPHGLAHRLQVLPAFVT